MKALVVAGLAGVGMLVAELTPQRYGFEDTDDPAVGIAFLTAHPLDWTIAGDLMLVTALALVVAVIGVGGRLGETIGPRVTTAIGLLSAAFLFGHGVIRLSGGPLLYVAGLDAGWGETAYLVTQFVGVHLLAQGGITLLTVWIVAVAWLGVREGVVRRPVAILAVLPGLRLLAFLAPWSLLPDGLWIFFMAAIPAAFLWLVLLGVSSADTRANRAPNAVGVPESAKAGAS